MAENGKNQAMLSNRAYDVLKAITQYWLPAAGVLYASLAATWGLAYGFEVSATVLAVDTFLAAVLGLSNKSYENSGAAYDGALVLDESDPDVDRYDLEVDIPIQDIKTNKSINLKVKNPGL